MSETLSNPNVVYAKFQKEGDTVAGLFDSVSWDQPSRFGVESTARVVDDQGQTVQFRLAASLIGIFKGHEKRLVPGKTHLTVKYLGMQKAKKDPTKTYKAFDVKADGLLPKDGTPPVAPPAAPARTPGSDDGDDSFDPKALS